MPTRVAGILGVESLPVDRTIGRASVGFLRWALGSSPSWNVGLVRVGAPIPDGLFHQPLPVADSTAIGAKRTTPHSL